MRTTLTLDDDVARRLKEIARAGDRSFKDVVNDAIRRGLNVGEAPPPELPPFVVGARAHGFKSGFDATKLNQLYDDLEMEASRSRAGSGVHEP